MAAHGNQANLYARRKILGFAAVVEVGTGLALIVDPALVIRLLLHTNEFGRLMPLARCFGIALIALGLACWPSRPRAGNGAPALRGMLTYNALIASFLAYLGAIERVDGLLLWPAVGLHALVAVLLVGSWLAEARSKTAH